jgi:hypothetical protein
MSNAVSGMRSALGALRGAGGRTEAAIEPLRRLRNI